MSRRAAAFTQADVRRALRAAQLAQPGVAFAVEIGGGVARIVPIAASAAALVAAAPPPPANDDEKPIDKGPKWIP